MIRFVDIRNQDTGYRFAFWDTVRDRFETHGMSMAWDTWAEFEAAYEGEDLDRYRQLRPPWVDEL